MAGCALPLLGEPSRLAADPGSVRGTLRKEANLAARGEAQLEPQVGLADRPWLDRAAADRGPALVCDVAPIGSIETGVGPGPCARVPGHVSFGTGRRSIEDQLAELFQAPAIVDIEQGVVSGQDGHALHLGASAPIRTGAGHRPARKPQTGP